MELFSGNFLSGFVDMIVGDFLSNFLAFSETGHT